MAGCRTKPKTLPSMALVLPVFRATMINAKKYSKKNKKRLELITVRATDVLYKTMVAYDKEHKSILNYLIDQVKESNNNLAQLKQLYILMNKAGEVAIDCAHKLAPYQSPKLESIEVRNQVEHKFVIRAPAKFKSVEEWAKATGATFQEIDPLKKIEHNIKEPAPSLHDFDSDQDEIETNKKLYN